jgi:hypothetical protein
MKLAKRQNLLGLVMVLALAGITFTPRPANAQRTDINRQEMDNFDRFLDAHPQIRGELTQNPQLVNDPRYLQSHGELREFLASHNGVREELREYPGAFMRQENKQEARERGYNGGGYNGGGAYNGGYNGGYQGGGRDESQPNMEAALQHLRQAEESLNRGTSDKGGHRVRALGLIRQAEAEINSGMHYDDNHGGDRR